MNPYAEGFEAYQDGKPKSANPYGQDEAFDWGQGWKDAEAEEELDWEQELERRGESTMEQELLPEE